MRGNAEGELIGAFTVDYVEYKYFLGGGGRLGKVAVLVGENRGTSNAVQVPSTGDVLERLDPHIDACDDPGGRIFRSCPAIGALAVDSQISDALRQRANIELI